MVHISGVLEGKLMNKLLQGCTWPPLSNWQNNEMLQQAELLIR